MKISPSVFPVVVLIAGMAWLGARQREIHLLRDGEAMQPERRVGQAAGPFGSRDVGVKAPESTGARMRRLAKSLEEWGGAGWLRTNWGEMNELEGMGREELIALLEAMEETDVEKGRLERRVLDLLEKIDPEYVTRRTGRASALGEWGRVDPSGAVVWFEEQVAAGKLQDTIVGATEGRLQMKKSLVWGLGTSDPAAARRLIEKLPEAERAKLFQKWYSPGGWSMQAADLPVMADLMRAVLPEKDQMNLVTWPFWELGDFGETGLLEDWQQLDRYLSGIKATPEERAAVALAMAQNMRFPRASNNIFNSVPEDIDSLRAWVAREDPALVTEATAAALKTVAGRSEQDYEPWVDYALRLHAAGEGDAVLIAVLETYRTPQHPELAREMAERLQPGEDRERFLKKVEMGER